MFLALHVISLVASIVRPCLQALSVLLVFLPVALVSGSVQVTIHSEPMRFVVLPVPIVDVPIRMDQPALAIGFVVSPPPLIHGAVWPYLNALSLSHIRADQPLALVLSPILQNHSGSELTTAQGFVVVAVVEVTQLLSYLLYAHVNRVDHLRGRLGCHS
jgi:hypothetical protein